MTYCMRTISQVENEVAEDLNHVIMRLRISFVPESLFPVSRFKIDYEVLFLLFFFLSNLESLMELNGKRI